MDKYKSQDGKISVNLLISCVEDLVPELFKTAQRVGAIYGDVWYWDGFSGGDGEIANTIAYF